MPSKPFQNTPGQWVKKGLVIHVKGQRNWMLSHAMVPSILMKDKGVCRVYFSSRDSENRSRIGYADVDLKKDARILKVADQPVLDLGELGCFDDNGVTPSWLVVDGKRIYMYYIGWNKRSTVRMSLASGLAISDDGGETFRRVLRVPVLDRTDREPFLLNTGPCVVKQGARWRMWYVSGIRWDNPDLPVYNVKYAESLDGVHWDRGGHVCIDFQNKQEHALARPCVVQEDNKYKMWYSYKGADYRVGYAESTDGLSWVRMDDQAGISVSPGDFDSQMIEYAYVLNYGGIKYMFYNGNDYGKEGIGLATMEGK